ncbi:Electron transfer DM13 [Pseudobythopirellula maris]|uniref:Electron transfer DM13 n=1 Tax=Pseudobythopirellula maris TaxID=2527991 RepID=A0A5C5ZMB8_9BACT|nr:DM13 domain-containing protein [Pseudobythopirellula maris]TWT88300.1 Electron transfer DM13 [Pseudobythopirellula maris]
MKNALILMAFALTMAVAAPVVAAPLAGWTAELDGLFHNVSGSLTVIDDDTLRVDDFTYDGGGIVVYFYLGAEDSGVAYNNGLEIGPQLKGTSFDGTEGPFEIDLPAGETIGDWNAVSVWCVTAGVSFGSGEFVPPVPEPATLLLASVALTPTVFGRRR